MSRSPSPARVKSNPPAMSASSSYTSLAYGLKSRILGVPYKRAPLSFHGIRGELAQACGNDKVTVPTLLRDGQYITDSRVIADYVR